MKRTKSLKCSSKYTDYNTKPCVQKSTHGFFICQIKAIVKILKSYFVLSLLFLHLNKQFRNQHFKTPFDRAMLNLKNVIQFFCMCRSFFYYLIRKKRLSEWDQADVFAIDFWL